MLLHCTHMASSQKTVKYKIDCSVCGRFWLQTENTIPWPKISYFYSSICICWTEETLYMLLNPIHEFFQWFGKVSIHATFGDFCKDIYSLNRHIPFWVFRSFCLSNVFYSSAMSPQNSIAQPMFEGSQNKYIWWWEAFGI